MAAQAGLFFPDVLSLQSWKPYDAKIEPVSLRRAWYAARSCGTYEPRSDLSTRTLSSSGKHWKLMGYPVSTKVPTYVPNVFNKSDILSLIKKINLQGTLNLAQHAAMSGVKRFIFISSIKVNGEKTNLDQPFTEQDKPKPADGYGFSKWEAERGLQKLSKNIYGCWLTF